MNGKETVMADIMRWIAARLYFMGSRADCTAASNRRNLSGGEVPRLQSIEVRGARGNRPAH
jgi:hypothetical protein